MHAIQNFQISQPGLGDANSLIPGLCALIRGADFPGGVAHARLALQVEISELEGRQKPHGPT